MVISDLSGLPKTAETAVIINAGTKYVTTLALLSTLRHAQVPTIVLDCASQDGSFGWFEHLLADHEFYLMPAKLRQLCWAHLKRDFQKIVEGAGPSAFVGHQGLRLVKKVFAAWHAFQAGRCTRAQLQEQLAPVDRRLNRVLIEGSLGNDATVAAFCDNVLKLEPALWTFVSTEGVEPTNNFIERLLRRAVLWRKRSFGCWSDRGCRFVERILTVVQTRRLQGKNVLDYLHTALLAHRTGQPCPKLLADG